MFLFFYSKLLHLNQNPSFLWYFFNKPTCLTSSSPYSPTVKTGDYDETVAGDIYQSFTSPSTIVVDYPTNEAEGNDDLGAEDEDNNPYSGVELQPSTTIRTPLGQLASFDHPVAPVWIKAAGTGGERLEWRLNFREFVRLQIGNKWYRISDFIDGEWKHIAKVRKVAGDWVDDGSTAEGNNKGFYNPPRQGLVARA